MGEREARWRDRLVELCTGLESCDCPDCEDDYDGERAGRCHWCGGDGWVPCDDPIQCTTAHNALDECECASCGGTGRARDMTIW